MKKQSAKSTEQLRKQHNYDLIRRMRSGDALYAFDSQASWYPPRPSIKKDEQEMARLYCANEDKAAEQRKQGVTSLVVLPRPADHDDHQDAG